MASIQFFKLKSAYKCKFRRVSVYYKTMAFMAVLYCKYLVSGLNIAILVNKYENKVSLLASIKTSWYEISGLNILHLHTIKL